jgi:DNA-binding CsgD family transcriptional regulator
LSHSATLDVQRRIANAIARSGSHEFYAALLDLTRSYTGFRLASLVRYSRIGIPELVYPGDFSPALSGKYLDFFYSFDPFHIYWQQGGPAVWVSLTNVAQPDFWSTSYANEFLIPFGISDEVCFFMPPLGAASVGVIVDRPAGRFTRSEMDNFRDLYPLLCALHDNHIRMVLLTGQASEPDIVLSARPIRLLDSGGNELFATQAWRELAAGDLSRAEHAPAGGATVALSGNRALLRTALPNDFFAAPGGTVEQIDPVGLRPTDLSSNNLPEHIAGRLTEREYDIVLLILRGYPTASIAERLNLSLGTVKNHRSRIYAKLDITTERELFLEVMNVGTPRDH